MRRARTPCYGRGLRSRFPSRTSTSPAYVMHGAGKRKPANGLLEIGYVAMAPGEPAPSPWPTEIKLHKDRKALTVAFDNGESFTLAAEYLRIKSPSAEVQGHAPEERKTVPGNPEVQILKFLPVGNYAVRLDFASKHSTGIYASDYLPGLGPTHTT